MADYSQKCTDASTKTTNIEILLLNKALLGHLFYLN